MTDAREVAQAMVDLIADHAPRSADAAWVAREMKERFGPDWTEHSSGGDLAVPDAVKKEFKKLKPANVVYNRGDHSWRTLTDAQLAEHERRAADRRARRSAI